MMAAHLLIFLSVLHFAHAMRDKRVGAQIQKLAEEIEAREHSTTPEKKKARNIGAADTLGIDAKTYEEMPLDQRFAKFRDAYLERRGNDAGGMESDSDVEDAPHSDTAYT